MDLSTLRTRCAQRFRDENNDIVTADEWDDYVNDAYADVVAADPYWPFLESQSENNITSTGVLTLPDDAWRVTAVFDQTNDVLLAPLTSRSQYRSLYPNPETLGTPAHYRLRNNVLEVYPRPDTTVEIVVDYFAPPAELTASDEPVFPEQFHRSLVSGALAYAYEDDGNDRQADRHRAKFDREVARMRDYLVTARTDSYPAIEDTWY